MHNVKQILKKTNTSTHHRNTLCIMSKTYTISNNPNAILIKFSCEMMRLSQPRKSTTLVDVDDHDDDGDADSQ